MAATKKGTSKKAATAASPSTASAGKTTPAAKVESKTKPTTNGKAATKTPAALKLTDSQKTLLAKVHGAGESGYEPTPREQRSIDSLADKKLLKKTAKDKATGKVRYLLTKTGQKHASAAAPATA